MRLRNVKNAMDILNNSDYVIKEPEKFKGKYHELFGNDNPIHIEIGMGKGNFIIGNAKEYPNINFIGIEKYESVMVRAVQKLEQENLPNLKLIRLDALNICDIFDKEIDTLYLNFSDPWPKTRHEKRRLTSDIFLKLYENIFEGDYKIKQKTDNIGLFQYSLLQYSKHDYKLIELSLDLHNEEIFNINTEYEAKFSSQGVKINYVYAVKLTQK